MMKIETSSPLQMRGLKPASELAINREHGDRLRYMAGCRCQECRRANSAYESARQKARAAGDWNGIVTAEKARLHIKLLSHLGIGRRAVAAASDIAESMILEISAGRKKRIRARTEKALLAVTEEAASDHALVSAAATWKMLDELIQDGYSKAELARRLGYKSQKLQLQKDFITVRNAYLVERMYAQLRWVNGQKTAALLDDLRAEGYSRVQVERRLADLARERGQDVPELRFRNGRIPEKTANLVALAYEAMTA